MSEWNDETVEWYAEKYGEYPTNRLAADAVEVAVDATVVDVGCGTGAALRRIAGRVPDGALIGVDAAERMIEIARERAALDPNGARIEFRVGPAEQLPIDDDVADIVFAFDSVHHWSDQARGFKEVHRILKSGGTLAVVKDGGLPGGSDAKRSLLAEFDRAGFTLLRELNLQEDDVRCTLWIARAASSTSSQ